MPRRRAGGGGRRNGEFEQSVFDFDQEPESSAPVVTENHRRFLQHLRGSEAARWQVAHWLTGRGYTVQLQGMKEAPTANQWLEYTDIGDIHVSMRVEAKQLTRDFTCREDWPFGKNFIVCGKNSFDRAQPKPFAFVILNPAGTHAAFVLASGWKQWRVESRRDSRYNGVEQEYYFAPLDSVVFAALAKDAQSANNKL